MSDLDDRIQECPHCFARVMVTSDGRCPTCWQNVRVPNKSGRRRQTIRVDGPIPTLCVVCGEPTRRWIQVTDQIGEEAAYNSDDNMPRNAIEFVVYGLMVGFIRMLLRRPSTSSGHVINELSVSLPQCRRCRKDEVKVLNANHHDRTLVVAAHECFIKELKQVQA